MSGDDPVRLAALPQAARRDLETVQSSPLGFDVEEQLARFHSRVRAGGASPRPATFLHRPGLRRAVWVAACLALTSAAVALSGYWRKPTSPAQKLEPPRRAATLEVGKVPPENGEAPAVPLTPSTPASAAPAEARPPALARSSPPASAQLKDETEQLSHLKSIYAKDPARALRLCDEADRRFAGGVFGVEREAIRIMSLNAVGQHEQARSRAKVYLARYPRGPLAQSIRSIAPAE